MPKLTDIPDADPETTYPLAVRFPAGKGADSRDDVVINLKYRALTDERVTRLGAQSEQLAAVIAEWDLTDEKGKAIAPTVEFFQSRPVRFRNVLERAISEDYFPK